MEPRITVNLQLESETGFVKSFWKAAVGNFTEYGQQTGLEILILKLNDV
jgi:hypothetical protein